MAVVTSLTHEKIKELMAGWESLGLTQEQINALVIQLRNMVESQEASLIEFSEHLVPSLVADMSANSAAVSELSDATIPALQQDLEQASLAIQNLSEVDIPSIREDLDAEITNGIDRPKVYVQSDEPTNPDADDRYLVVGDTWFNSNENNRQRIWNGVEWSTFNVDVADFSLTVRSFLSTKHQIY